MVYLNFVLFGYDAIGTETPLLTSVFRNLAILKFHLNYVAVTGVSGAERV